jgi:hypothetical protein
MESHTYAPRFFLFLIFFPQIFWSQKLSDIFPKENQS